MCGEGLTLLQEGSSKKGFIHVCRREGRYRESKGEQVR